LIVHLDTVHLVITADSECGILGSLLCSLAGGGAVPLEGIARTVGPSLPLLAD
jgi:hypothetical protein